MLLQRTDAKKTVAGRALHCIPGMGCAGSKLQLFRWQQWYGAAAVCRVQELDFKVNQGKGLCKVPARSVHAIGRGSSA